MSLKICSWILKNFSKFTGKYLCQSFFFNKVAGLRPANLLKKRLWHRSFPVNIAIQEHLFTEHLWTTASAVTRACTFFILIYYPYKLRYLKVCGRFHGRWKCNIALKWVSYFKKLGLWSFVNWHISKITFLTSSNE